MISVCLASYNGEKYIKEQVDSILKQLGPDDEIVVSDNYSKDRTIDILKGYNDIRIKLFQIESRGDNAHEAVSSNFENALKRCNGDFIFLSDQDDIWPDNKVEVFMSYFSKGYDLLVSNHLLMKDSIDNLTALSYKNPSPIGSWLIGVPKYYGCCMAFNRKILNYSLPFPKHLPLHDNWIGIIGELTGKCFFIEVPLLYYRVHGDNTTIMTSNSISYKIWYRLKMYFQLLVRLMRVKFLDR